MADERSALSRAFDKARHSTEHWQHQQIAVLTDEQREEFDRWRQEQQRKLEQEKKQIEARRQQWVEEAKKRQLLERPEPALRLGSKKPVSERRAEQLARADAERRVQAALDRADRDRQTREAEYLRRAVQERTATKAFNRAGAADRQRSPLARAFDKAAQRREQSHQHDLARKAGRDRQRGEG